MNESMRARLLGLQKMEATESRVYRKLALMQDNPVNRTILEAIAMEEERHELEIRKLTGEDVKPNTLKVWKHVLFAKLFGFTFSIKMMEATEKDLAK